VKDPISFFCKTDFALESAKLVIIKLNITVGHSAYLNLLASLKLVDHISLRSVYKFKLNLVITPFSPIRGVVAFTCLGLVEINYHVRVSERDYKSMFQSQRNVQPHKSARAIAQVAHAVVAIVGVVFDYKVALANS